MSLVRITIAVLLLIAFTEGTSEAGIFCGRLCRGRVRAVVRRVLFGGCGQSSTGQACCDLTQTLEPADIAPSLEYDPRFPIAPPSGRR